MFERVFGWSRSLYWRIAASFAVFTLGMLLLQNLLFRYLVERPDPSFLSPLSPNAMALIVAADVQQGIATDPSVNLDDYLQRKYAATRQPIYVVVKDGRIGGNRREPLSEEMRQAAAAMLAGGDVGEVTARMQSRAPIVTAPIQVDDARDGGSAAATARNGPACDRADGVLARCAAAHHRRHCGCGGGVFSRAPPSAGAREGRRTTWRRRPRRACAGPRRRRDCPRRNRIQPDGIRAGRAR